MIYTLPDYEHDEFHLLLIIISKKLCFPYPTQIFKPSISYANGLISNVNIKAKLKTDNKLKELS